MDYNIREQIGTWQSKIAYYKSKESRLRERIKTCEGLRDNVDELPVGNPNVDKFYHHLNSLYKQLSTLPTKIRHCEDNISTLKCEL